MDVVVVLRRRDGRSGITRRVSACNQSARATAPPVFIMYQRVLSSSECRVNRR